MATFVPGDHIFWWKRIGRDVQYPYRAEVVRVGPKRITITVEDPDDAENRFVRHVHAENLQPVGGYFAKAVGQGPEVWEAKASWGRFIRYLEIGDDLWVVRQVDVFKNGNILSYDRSHWVDEF